MSARPHLSLGNTLLVKLHDRFVSGQTALPILLLDTACGKRRRFWRSFLLPWPVGGCFRAIGYGSRHFRQ